jgi:hypothetical protein
MSRRASEELSTHVAWVDDLERRVDSWFPPPRSPAASVLAALLRFLLGRAGFVVGLFLVAFSAPWFVHPYRQVETMVAAAWFRQQATATTDVRVERIELHLMAHRDGDTGLGVLPSIVLVPFDGSPPLRYFPGGHWRADEMVLDDLPSELASPLRVTPGWSLPWSASPAITLHWDDDIERMMRAPHPPGMDYMLTHRQDLMAVLDRPLDRVMSSWMHETDARVGVRLHPSAPQRVFVEDALQHLPPGGGSGAGELFSALAMLLPALPFWFLGTRLVARGLPVRHRHVATWLPLLLLPLWGTRYVDFMDRHLPDGRAIEREVRHALGSMQVLPASELEAESEARVVRDRIDPATSRFAEFLAPIDLRRPTQQALDADAAWAELERRFVQQLASLDDEALQALLTGVFERDYYSWSVAPLMLQAVEQAMRDPARSAEAHAAAEDFLLSFLGSDKFAPDTCHPGHPAFIVRLRELASVGLPKIADAAVQRESEERDLLPMRRTHRPRCERLDAGF